MSEQNETAPELGDMGAVAGQITDESIQEFLDGKEPTFRPILRIWREVLSNVPENAKQKMGPQYANRIVQSYAGVTFAALEDYQEIFFTRLEQLRQLVESEIESDPDCLKVDTPEDDREENSFHYKNLLLQWQLLFTAWELEWECTSPTAAVEIATMGELHRMFFGDTGLTAHLDNIKLEYTEADQETLAEALQQLRDDAKSW